VQAVNRLVAVCVIAQSCEVESRCLYYDLTHVLFFDPFCDRTEVRNGQSVSDDDVIMTSEERSINDDLRRPLMKFDLNTTQSGPKLTAVDAKETNVQSVVDNIKISLTNYRVSDLSFICSFILHIHLYYILLFHTKRDIKFI
jgi:hypothetical protein